MTLTAQVAWVRRSLGARGRCRALVGYGAFMLLVFLVSLAETLPHDLIARQALDVATAELPLRASFDTVAYSFPAGYRFSDVELIPDGDPARTIQIDDLTVRLPFLPLLLGRTRSALFSGKAYGGEFQGSVTDLDSRFAAEVQVEGLDLARATAPFLPQPGRVGGRTDFSLELAGDGRTTRSSEGKLELSAEDLSIEKITAQGVLLPDLRFPEVTLRAEIHGGRLQISELRSSGDELNVQAKGDVLLREPLPLSTLNLQFQLDISAQAPPGIRVAAGLLPKRTAGSTQPYVLRGTLAAPTVR